MPPNYEKKIIFRTPLHQRNNLIRLYRIEMEREEETERKERRERMEENKKKKNN